MGRLEADVNILQSADRLTLYVRTIAPTAMEPVNQISQKVRTVIGSLMAITQDIRGPGQ